MTKPSDATKDDAKQGIDPGWFPFKYLVDFIRFLHRHDDVIEIITYDDLAWGDDWDYQNSYQQEFENWKCQLARGERDPSRIYVLLQHDVDRLPDRTAALLYEEERLEVPSNVMLFNRQLDRRLLKTMRELAYCDYEINDEYLRHLQDDCRFVIAYHSNAYEQALFDADRALEIFQQDVTALRQRFRVHYFSPHGGVRDAKGCSNARLEVPLSLRKSIRWVANGFTVRFDGSYSDGGIHGRRLDPAHRDLRQFVRSWKRGKRYRVLTHPQYYFSPHRRSGRLAGTPWYDEILETYASDLNGNAWNDVWNSVLPPREDLT